MPALVRIWILGSAVLVGAGWILSALHELNRTGYGIVFALVAAVWIASGRGKKFVTNKPVARPSRKFRSRFTRPLPVLFLALAFLSFLGGLLYVSTDGDGLAYRIPRVLHWLWSEQWQWVRTLDYRMNIAGCGFEWLAAPFILFTGTDRYLFLINWLAYLMLPGLIFSVFIRLGVRPRVAWWWMWLLPSGWCYAMQAGSCHNDSFAVIYALAAVDLALRAREKQRVGDLCLSLLAAALATGVKQTDIPLGILWFVAAWPARRLFLNHPLAGLATGAAGLLVSAVPMMLIDQKHIGTWTGVPATVKGEMSSPIWAIIGNSFCLPVQNLMPPVFPWADRWNAAMEHFLQTPWGAHFRSFEDFGHLKHSVSDETAGIGLGICVLVLISHAAGWWHRQPPMAQPANLSPSRWHSWLLRLTPWLLLLLYMAKVGTTQNGRQFGPYYVLLFPLLLCLPVYTWLLRRRWWRYLSGFLMLLTALLLVTSRQRPIFPFQTLIAGLQSRYPHSQMLAKAWDSYDFRSSFEKFRGLFAKDFPPNVGLIAYATTGGNAEPGLSLPFGRLKVERLLPEDSPAQLRRAGIHFIVVDDWFLALEKETVEQWSAQFGGRLVDQMTFILDPHEPPSHIYLIRLNDPPAIKEARQNAMVPFFLLAAAIESEAPSCAP